MSFTRVSVWFAVFLLTSCVSVPEASWPARQQAVVWQHIVPAYQRLQLSAKHMRDRLSHYCQLSVDVRAPQLGGVKSAFKALYIDWAAIQHLRVGPVTYLQRDSRFQYWPDKHRVTRRQLQRLLASMGDHFTLSKLQTKSVALQGLPALERLIFSSPPLVGKSCVLALSISENLSVIATRVDQSWREPPVNFAAEFATHPLGSGSFDSTDEISSLFFNQLLTQLKIITQLKLAFAFSPTKASGLEAWKSDLSLLLIKENLKHLHTFYRLAFEAHVYAASPQKAMAIAKQFAVVKAFDTSLDQPLYLLAKHSRVPGRVKKWQAQIIMLEHLLAQTLTQALGLSTTFNALDGD